MTSRKVFFLASVATVFVASQLSAQGVSIGGADAGAGVKITTDAAAPSPSASTAAGDGGPAPVDTSGVDGGFLTTSAIPTFQRKVQAPLPPPTKDQVDALEALQKAVNTYRQGAAEYQDTVTSIIKMHYEEKKKSILTGLDREITTEKAELKKARETAIKALRDFVDRYEPMAIAQDCGKPAQPGKDRAYCETTPDAMYRLAALYEEIARSEDATEDLTIGLHEPIRIYKRIINEFPEYRELAGIYYYLGHAYNDSSRMEEAQQVWRSLVCHNKYTYPSPTDPKNPDVDAIIPLPQDNTKDFWKGWRQKYSLPKFVKKGNPETTFADPYPNECVGIPQPNLRPGEDPKFVAEVWWQVGNWEFDQLDMRGGVVDDEPIAVWDLNRAASAYVHSLNWKKPPLYGVALYKYAWTLFKQQRYEAATKEFVKLLVHTDELEKTRGDANVGDFRTEAYTYIAGSLTNIDFTGPDPDDPFIQRPDIVDSGLPADQQEKKLHIAIDRVRDPNLIPQDKPWTIEIYKALAAEFRSLNQFQNAIEVYDTILKKWPMDPTAPEVQNSIAETYDQILVTKKIGADRDAIASKALEARTKLANYIGNTPWVDANKENPGAIQNAERLVRGGLRQAAAAHTNLGKQLLVLALQSSNEKESLDYLNRASGEYKLATLGWSGYLHQDENAPDAYESRFWLADSRNKQVRVQFILHTKKKDAYPEPTEKEITDAMAAAVDVRDSNEDDKYLDVSAQFVVEEADVGRDLAYQKYDDSKGTQGMQKRTDLEMVGEGDDARPKQVAIPAALLLSMRARDEYVSHVPVEKDLAKNSTMFQFDVGDVYFVYGDFQNARARFEPLWQEHAGKDEFGCKAYEKLLTMAARSHDIDRSMALADAEKKKTCAAPGTTNTNVNVLVGQIGQEAGYVLARRKLEEAKKSPPGPNRDKLFREAGGLYEAALQAAPGRKEAPEAAMNAAYAYKYVNDYERAIKMYELFIREYGKEETLKTLDVGDPKKGIQPNKKELEARIAYLQVAYDALGTTYYGYFNYQKAADTYYTIANNKRFSEDDRTIEPDKVSVIGRKTAAKNAMLLFNAIGQRDKMQDMYKTVLALKVTPEQKANYDYLVASFDFQQWNPNDKDAGQNQRARQAAEAALAQFYAANKGNPAASKYTVEAAWRVAKMKQSANDAAYHAWFTNTVTSWELWKAPMSKDGKNTEKELAPYSDYAGEGEFTLIDEEIRDKFDYDTNHHRYITMNAEGIMGKVDQKTGKYLSEGQYRTDAKQADDYDIKLEKGKRFKSVLWTPAMFARQGSLYDSLRTGLYNCGGSAFKLFTPAQTKLLTQMRNSGRDDLVDQADNIEGIVKDAWKKKRDQEIDAADTLMVKRYAQAIAQARAFSVRNPTVARAIGRMAFLTDIIGDAKLRTYVTAAPDPNNSAGKLSYTDGMFVQTRPGLVGFPPQQGTASPLPVAP